MVISAAPAPWITPVGQVPVMVGRAASTISVTLTVSVLSVAPGAAIVIAAEYVLGARPVGFTVTAIVFSNPISDTLPVGLTVSHVAPVTLRVAESAAPVLDSALFVEARVPATLDELYLELQSLVHDRVVGGYLSASELAHYEKLKSGERETGGRNVQILILRRADNFSHLDRMLGENVVHGALDFIRGEKCDRRV